MPKVKPPKDKGAACILQSARDLDEYTPPKFLTDSDGREYVVDSWVIDSSEGVSLTCKLTKSVIKPKEPENVVYGEDGVSIQISDS